MELRAKILTQEAFQNTAPLTNRLEVYLGDITQVDCDGLVTAANSALVGGGGVDGAVHLAGGPKLLEACMKWGGCPTGEARITEGFALGKPVIHAVGPFWRGGRHGEEALLVKVYESALTLASQQGIETLAIPCISTGVYGYPPEMASRIAFSTVTSYLFDQSTPSKIIFVCFDERNYSLYKELEKEAES